MKLRALKFFNESGMQVQAGAVIDVPDMLACYLMDSWSGSWERYTEPAPEVPAETAAIEAPAVDKMIRKPTSKKARR